MRGEGGERERERERERENREVHKVHESMNELFVVVDSFSVLIGLQ